MAAGRPLAAASDVEMEVGGVGGGVTASELARRDEEASRERFYLYLFGATFMLAVVLVCVILAIKNGAAHAA